MEVERGEGEGVEWKRTTRRKKLEPWLAGVEAELITTHVKRPQPMRSSGFVMTWMMSQSSMSGGDVSERRDSRGAVERICVSVV
jgi:hypothetical protein